jgi:hypothetical protein
MTFSTRYHYKSKSVPLHVVEAFGWRGGIAPTHSDLGTRWGEWLASRPVTLYLQGKDPRYPLGRRLRVSQSRPGHRG